MVYGNYDTASFAGRNPETSLIMDPGLRRGDIDEKCLDEASALRELSVKG